MHVPAASVAIQLIGLLLEFCLTHQQHFDLDHWRYRKTCRCLMCPYISVQSMSPFGPAGSMRIEHVLQLPSKAARIAHSLCGSCSTCSICFTTSCSEWVHGLQPHAMVLSASMSPAKTRAEPRYLHWHQLQLTMSQQLACDHSAHSGIQRTGTVGATATSKPKNAG